MFLATAIWASPALSIFVNTKRAKLEHKYAQMRIDAEAEHKTKHELQEQAWGEERFRVQHAAELELKGLSARQQLAQATDDKDMMRENLLLMMEMQQKYENNPHLHLAVIRQADQP